jgi:hypothetical protein
MDETTTEVKLYWDNFGDVRCKECIPEVTMPGYEAIIPSDLKIMGELVESFSRELTCTCGKVVWNTRKQVLEKTP